MRAIDARPSTKPFEVVDELDRTTEKLRRGEAISLDSVPEEWKGLPIFLDEQSLPFVFYISDQGFFRFGNEYKFHFRWCSTLKIMSKKGRIQRYRAKYDICNPKFEINDGSNKKELKVCLNCCKNFTIGSVYELFGVYPGDKKIVDKFRMPEFFEEFGKIDLPSSTHPGGKDGYTRNWPAVSRREKEKARWKCQNQDHNGERDFSHDKSNLHVHHKSGVKSNNLSSNLEVVCYECHSKKPGHEHMRK